MSMAPHSSDLTLDQDPVTILADSAVQVGRVPEAGTVSAVGYTANAAVAGAASPASRTLLLVNVTQSKTIATLALVGGVNLVHGVEKAIPISATVADYTVAAGDQLEWQSTHVGGTGLVDPGGLVRVTITRTTASQ